MGKERNKKQAMRAILAELAVQVENKEVVGPVIYNKCNNNYPITGEEPIKLESDGSCTFKLEFTVKGK